METFYVKIGKESTELYLKSDDILLADIFGNFIEVSINAVGINPLYCVRPPGSTFQYGLKNSNIKLETLQDKDLILLFENNFQGATCSLVGDRNVKSDENEKLR